MASPSLLIYFKLPQKGDFHLMLAFLIGLKPTNGYYILWAQTWSVWVNINLANYYTCSQNHIPRRLKQYNNLWFSWNTWVWKMMSSPIWNGPRLWMNLIVHCKVRYLLNKEKTSIIWDFSYLISFVLPRNHDICMKPTERLHRED